MKRLYKFLFALTLIASTCAVVAAERLPVVVSFSVLADLVRAVGGERVKVESLVGPDQDAHVFEPSPGDARKVAQSRLLVSNGLGFDSWMDKLARSADRQAVLVVASAGIKARRTPEEGGHKKHKKNDEHGEHGHAHELDPHAFQDPIHVITYVRNIRKALSAVDPDGAAVYEKNAASYEAELKRLDRWIVQELEMIAPSKRRVITSHDAFAYLGARYQITFLAPQGISTDSEASSRDVALLIRQIRQNRIKAIHVENMASPKLLEQISREAGVTMGSRLYADALSAAGGPADSYLKLMRYNMHELVKSMKLN